MAKKIKKFSNLAYQEQQKINKLIKKKRLDFVDVNFNQELKKAIIINEEEDELLIIMDIKYFDEDDDEDEEDIVEDEIEIDENDKN